MPLVTPDVPQVEPVADLVRSRSPFVEGCSGRAGRAKAGVRDHHAVGRGRPARELRVSEQPADELAHPHVEILDRPARRRTHPLDANFTASSLSKPSRFVCFAMTPSVGHLLGLQLRVRTPGERLPPAARMAPARCETSAFRLRKSLVQDGDLALDLVHRDVLCSGLVDNMDNDRDLGASKAHRGRVPASRGTSVPRSAVAPRHISVRIEKAVVHLHRFTGSRFWRVHSCHLYSS